MTKLYCSYTSNTWSTRDADPEDPWDSGDEDGTYDVVGVHLGAGWYDAFDSPEEVVVGDKVWVVWVQYGSGSTFGSDAGYGSIVAVTKNEDLAVAAAAWAEGTITDGRSASLRPGRRPDRSAAQWPKELGDTEQGVYQSWNGYFEWGQVVKIASFVVQP